MAKIAKENEVIEEITEEIANESEEEITEDVEIQTTFNDSSLEILVEEGVVENVCD